MAAVEADIAAAGHDCAQLSATLNSTAFFRAIGYRGRKPIMLRLPQGRRFCVMAMGKWLAEALAVAA